MADFNWYINRQGIRGHKGNKGDQGFSPYFTEEVNTMNEYRLRVHNEFDSFVTDNLRGNKIQLVNPDGTYVKYDKETGNFYVDSADYATGEIYGQVRLATLADVDLFDTESVLTPDVLSDTLPRYLVNEDGNITIEQGVDSKTHINLADTIVSRDGEVYLTTSNFYQQTQNPIRLTKTYQDGKRAVLYRLSYNESHFSVDTSDNNKLTLSNSILNNINSKASQTEVNNLRSDLDTERTTRLNADNQINAELAAERSERQVQDAALQNQLGTKLTVDNIKAGNNIELTKDGNNVTINSKGGSDLELYEGENIYFTQHTKEIVIPAYTDISKYMPVIPRSDVFTTRHLNFISNTNDSPNSSYIRIGGNEGYDTRIIIDGNVSGIAYAYTYVDGVREKQLSLTKGDERVIIELEEDADKHKIIELRTNDNITIQKIMIPSRINLVYEEEGTTVINSTGGGGGAIIDDETVSTDKVFSSSRTSELVGEVGNDLQDLAQRVNDIESLKVPNVVIIGEPMIQNGQVSDLDEQNHLQFPFIIERKGRPFECNFEFTTGADITRQQNIIDSRCSVAVAVRGGRLVGALSNNGTDFNLGERTIYSFSLQPYTTYYCKLVGAVEEGGLTNRYTLGIDIAPFDDFTGIQKTEWVTTVPLYPTTMTIGSDGNSFDGVLDLNKWSLKIDNDLVWLGMDNVGQAVSANVSLSNINEAGVKVINDLIDAKLGIVEALVDDINGEVN